MSSAALISPPIIETQGRRRDRMQPSRTVSPGGGQWRFQRKEEDVTVLSWVVGIAATFLLIGTVGILEKEPSLIEEITLGGRAGMGATDTETTDVTMAELHAEEEAPQVLEEQAPTLPLELTEPIEMPLEELPELAEALVTEDVFVIPAAPRVDQPLRPVDPALPKPKPKATAPTSRAKSNAQPSRATTVASGTTGGSQGAGGGSGGTKAKGSGGGGGRQPKPPYPSSARARGVTGTMTIALTVSPSGAVESASAVGSSGRFTSGEMASVASYIKRNWKFGTGAYRKFNQPIRFQLN